MKVTKREYYVNITVGVYGALSIFSLTIVMIIRQTDRKTKKNNKIKNV